MKIIILVSAFLCTFVHAAKLELGRDVYRPVPFSSQYSEDGALIRNVYFPAVNALIPQLNNLYKIDLEDRRESHITVITPPEFKSSLSKVFTVDEILARYKTSIQNMPFKVICVGSRRSKDGKNLVFYLVVDSPSIVEIRSELAKEANRRAKLKGIDINFDPFDYSPHVTIGFINNDVFDFSKGPESCLKGVSLEVQR